MARYVYDYTLDPNQRRRNQRDEQAMWLAMCRTRRHFYQHGSENLGPLLTPPKHERKLMVEYDLAHLRRVRIATHYAERLP